MASANDQGLRPRREVKQYPAPLSLVLPAPPTDKSTLQQVCATVDRLWGSDRVLRSLQFAFRALAASPEIQEETRLVCATFSSAFSQARYVNRLYGIFDGVEGLVYDVPKGPTVERIAKLLVHGIGAVGYHVIEHSALILMIIRRCDPIKIPRLRGWLVRKGLWDKADDLDALAQWCWLVEALGKLVLCVRQLQRIARERKEARERRDVDGEEKLMADRAIVILDMVKLLADVPCAIHYGSMYNNRPGPFPTRWIGIIGLIGSMAQFVVRYRKMA